MSINFIDIKSVNILEGNVKKIVKTEDNTVLWTSIITISAIPSQRNTLTYTGSSQSPTWNNYDSTQLILSGTIKGTNAGNYTAKFTPKSGYCWSDGSTSAKSVNWTIGQAEINFSKWYWVTPDGQKAPCHSPVSSTSPAITLTRDCVTEDLKIPLVLYHPNMVVEDVSENITGDDSDLRTYWLWNPDDPIIHNSPDFYIETCIIARMIESLEISKRIYYGLKLKNTNFKEQYVYIVIQYIP